MRPDPGGWRFFLRGRVVYLTKHCHKRMTERLGMSAENLHEKLIEEMQGLGVRRAEGDTDYVQFGNCVIVCRGSTVVTFIRRRR